MITIKLEIAEVIRIGAKNTGVVPGRRTESKGRKNLNQARGAEKKRVISHDMIETNRRRSLGTVKEAIKTVNLKKESRPNQTNTTATKEHFLQGRSPAIPMGERTPETNAVEITKIGTGKTGTQPTKVRFIKRKTNFTFPRPKIRQTDRGKR